MNAAAQVESPRRLRLRVEDFLLLNQSGAFADLPKTELIDGEIFCMNEQFLRHAFVKSELAFRIRVALGIDSALLVISEVAVAIPPHDMPEPDVVVLRRPIGTGAAVLAQVVLLIEVADSTRDNDLGRKAVLYARGDIPEYWVVDLQESVIVRHWQPSADSYGQRDATPFGGDMASATLPGLVISTANLA